MSIFRSTFPDHVKNQLSARQSAMVSRTPQNLSYLNSRNAWVRMSSSVNVGPGDGTNELAKRYILQGGVLNSDGTKKEGLGADFQKAYSNISQKDRFYRLGIRPMPGITGVEIKSKSAYGSLREAVVSFQCWDIQQLEDLEVLYMRPGYTVLLEWGWAPYITSDGKYHPTFYDYYDIINKQNVDRTQLFKDLFEKSKKYEGNYDAMFGYVKNYQWSARMDGGYDCQTTIITTGEIIESLKVNYTYPNKVDSSEKGVLRSEFNSPIGNTEWFKAYEKNKLAGMWAELFYGINESINNSKAFDAFKTGNKKDGKYLSSVIDENDSLSKDGTQVYVSFDYVIYLLNTYIIAKSTGDSKPLIYLSLTSSPITGKEEDLLCVAHPLQISVDPGVCIIKNTLWGGGEVINNVQSIPTNDSNVDKAKEAYDLIKKGWEGNYVNPTNEDSLVAGIEKITSLEIYAGVQTLLETDDETDYNSLQDVLQGELGLTDGGIMRRIEKHLKNLGFGVEFEYSGNFEFDVDGDTIIITTPANYNANAAVSSEIVIEKKSTDALANIDYINKLNRNYFVDANPYSEIGILKNIYINVDYLYQKSLTAGGIPSADDTGKEEINLYNYVKTLLQDIQTAIGNVNNFEIHVDPIDNNVARVVDINYTEKTKVRYKDLFPLAIHELPSTVRSYSLQSQIFTNQSSIIAIGSQAKGGQLGMQNNTFIDFNRNLTDRIIPEKIGDEMSVDTGSKTTTITNGLAPVINAFSLSSVQIDPNSNSSYDDEIASAKTGLRDTIVYFQSLIKSPGSNRNLIPTKFSCEIDGIGGLVIGNMFRLPKHILPKGYRGEGVGSQLGNAVTSISHTIGKGDWSTKIDSLNIVLEDSDLPDIPITKELLGSILTTGEPDAATKKAIEEQAGGPPPPPGGGGGNANAMKLAGNAVFNKHGNTKSLCAQYTYHIAYYYTQALKGVSPSGDWTGGHGNAGDPLYRANLQSLGYTMSSLGTLTKQQLKDYISKINTIGTIVNYRSTIIPDAKQKYCSPGKCCQGCCAKANFTYCFGHTQIYTGGVLNFSNKSNWASSMGDNYNAGFVYNKYNIDSWEAYVFTL